MKSLPQLQPQQLDHSLSPVVRLHAKLGDLTLFIISQVPVVFSDVTYLTGYRNSFEDILIPKPFCFCESNNAAGTHSHVSKEFA